MTRSRWWILGGAVAAVLILLLSWILLITPKRDDATAIRDQATSVQTTNQQLQARIAELQALAAGLPEQQAELDRIAVLLPPTAQLPELVRQLSAVAAETGVDLVSVAPASPTRWCRPGRVRGPGRGGTRRFSRSRSHCRRPARSATSSCSWAASRRCPARS